MNTELLYCIGYKTEVFFPFKTIPKSRSLFEDESSKSDLDFGDCFERGKIHFKTDLGIWGHSREGRISHFIV